MTQFSSPPAASHAEWVRFAVPFQYPVYFTRDLLEPKNTTLRETFRLREPHRRHRVLCCVDEGLATAQPELVTRITLYFREHAEQLELVRSPLLVAGGEACKNDTGLAQRLLAEMAASGLDRQSFCLVLGGGAVLDAVGFAAATCHRGVRVVRVPSTVLAQNDAGIGVKNGVNAFGAKNFVGSFAPPFAVINDSALLLSLSPRDRVAGCAEAVKVALIRDADFFAWLTAHATELANFDELATSEMIRRAARLHLAQIANGGDPFEFGSARPLDFGHWAAHKLEGLSHHGLRHGEAVAIGMMLDSRYAFEAGLLGAPALAEIELTLTRLGFRLFHPALLTRDNSGQLALLRGLDEFREHLGGELCVTLLHDIGKGVEVTEMKPELVLRSLHWLEARFAPALATG